MKASWEVSSESQPCDRAPPEGNVMGIAFAEAGLNVWMLLCYM